MRNTLEDDAEVGASLGTNEPSSAYPARPGTTVDDESVMYWKHRNKGLAFPLPSGPEVTIHPLRKGIERLTVTDINNPAALVTAQSDVVVMFDEISTNYGAVSNQRLNRVPTGMDLLYMDGHVKWGRVGTAGGHQWPVNQFAFKWPAVPNWTSPSFP